MSLKTDYDYNYNEDNFVEVDGQLKELTVTITLCEYRSIISELAYNEKVIEKLQEENEKLRKEIKDLKEKYNERFN